MTIVYRLEHRVERRGPFNYSGLDDLRYRTHKRYGRWRGSLDLRSQHVCPGNDKQLGRYPKPFEVCGCDCMEHLAKWFGSDVWLFKMLGFVVAEYSVPRESLSVGLSQVLFDERAATLVQDYCPTVLRSKL